MAERGQRRGTAQDADEPIDGEFQPVEPDPADEDAQIDLSNLLADIGEASEAQVHVYRQKEGTKKLSWIHTFSPSELDIGTLFHSLRHEMGGGMFRLQVRENGRIVKSRTIEIEPPTKRETELTERGMYGGVDLPGLIREMRSENSGDSTSLILNFMQQSNAQFQSMMTKMVEAMAGNRSEQPTMTDMVNTLVALKQLDGGNKSSDVDMLLRGLELAREFAGGGDRETNFMDVLSKSLSTFGGSFAKFAEAQAERSPQEIAALMAPQKQAGQPQANPSEEKTPDNAPAISLLPDDHILKAYEPTILMLVQCAQNDRNPETYAEVLIDQMGEEQARAVFLNREYLQAVVTAFPIIQHYAQWFDDLIGAVDFMTSGDDDSNESGDEGETGNVAQTSTVSYIDPNARHIDGHTERAGGGASDVAPNGEPSESGEDGDAGSRDSHGPSGDGTG